MDGLNMGNHGMGNHSMDNQSMGMHMTFYFGNDATILFAPWKVSSWQGMLWSCIVVLIVSFAYEGLKTVRQRLLKVAKVQQQKESTNSADAGDDDDRLLIAVPSSSSWTRSRRRIAFHLIQAQLHLVQVTVGYMLMLVAMTYNAWLFISLVIGATLGYLIFNYHSIFVDNLHNPCH